VTMLYVDNYKPLKVARLLGVSINTVYKLDAKYAKFRNSVFA